MSKCGAEYFFFGVVAVPQDNVKLPNKSQFALMVAIQQDRIGSWEGTIFRR